MRFVLVLLLCASLGLLTGCGKLFQNPLDYFTGGGSEDGRPSVTPERVVEPTEKYALAIGGVAPGRDELVISDGAGNIRSFVGQVLACTADSAVVQLAPRPGFDSEAAGSGVLMTAVAPGVAAVRCTVDGVDLGNVYEVTVPPQLLIQIFVAEAGEQLADEASIDTVGGEEVVALDSESATASALGAVVRNRIFKTNRNGNPGLFGADAASYDADPPASYYDAIILAPDQFSPVEPTDPTHSTFDDAQDRNFLSGEWLVAYDQAVLTAAGIFNGDITDITGGAFGFYSPTVSEWSAVNTAFRSGATELPDDAGISDDDYPEYEPIQLLIQPLVWEYSNGRPSFLFVRERVSADPAVSDTP